MLFSCYISEISDIIQKLGCNYISVSLMTLGFCLFFQQENLKEHFHYHSFHNPFVVTDSEDIHLVVRFVSFLDYDFFTDIFFKIVSVSICVYDRA